MLNSEPEAAGLLVSHSFLLLQRTMQKYSDKKKTLSNEIIAGYCVLPEVFFTFRIKRKFKLEKNQEAVQPRIGSASNMNHLYPTHTHARTFYLL